MTYHTFRKGQRVHDTDDPDGAWDHHATVLYGGIQHPAHGIVVEYDDEPGVPCAVDSMHYAPCKCQENDEESDA